MLFLLVIIKNVIGLSFSKSSSLCSEAVTDPVFDFMMTYLPVEEVKSDCRDRVCTCGKQALVNLINPGDDGHFGLGCVFAPGREGARWIQSGYLNVEALELILSNKFSDMSVYDVFMENNIGLYTKNITRFVEKLNSDDVEYLTLSWGKFVSVLVHPPSSQLLFEIIAEAEASPRWLVRNAEALSSPRFDFGERSLPVMNLDGDYMQPLWVSNLATSIDQVTDYFLSLFELLNPQFIISDGVDALGAKYKMLQVELTVTGQDWPTQLRFIEPERKTDGQFSIEWWEAYLKDVHEEFMRSPTCGWDVLGENRFSFSTSEDSVIDEILVKVEEMQYGHFCQHLENGNIDCFLNTPFGVQIELKGPSVKAHNYYTYENAQQCATYDEWCDTEPGNETDDQKIMSFGLKVSSVFSSGSTTNALWCTLGIAIVLLGHVKILPNREFKSSNSQKIFSGKFNGLNSPGKRPKTLGGKIHPDLTPVSDPDVVAV